MKCRIQHLIRGRSTLNGRTVCIMLIIVSIMTAGCINSANRQARVAEDRGKPLVYASIYPMYDFAKKIGGDRIDLRMAVPAGAEPHGWEPTARMLVEIGRADVFIYNGVGMEPWVDRMLASLSGSRPVVVEASEGIKLLEMKGRDRHGHSPAGYDPHVWLDPVRAKMQAESILKALVQVDRDNAEYYRANFRDFSAKLEELDRLYREALAGSGGREIVVSHAAFGYLADRYGLIQIPVSGLNPQEEPGAAELVQLAKLLQDKNIDHVFFETLTSPKLAETLAREVGAKPEVLNPIGGLTRQQMEEGMDYISIMKQNLETLKRVLDE
jgi:zinc transport system substrate-binding protein